MKKVSVKIITSGRFHHFHLARQLNKYCKLDEIYTGYPNFKLIDERQLLNDKIKTYPYFQVPYLFFNKYLGNYSHNLKQYLANLSAKKLSLKVSKNLGSANIIIATSNCGLEAGKKIKSLNGKFICDRGSTHISFQNEIYIEEYKKYDVKFNQISQKTINRELEEYEEADLISVPSKFALNSFIKKGIDKKKLFLNPYGVDMFRFGPLPKKEKKIFNVLYVGTISIRKGIFYLLEAFKKINLKKKQLTFIGNIEDNIKEKFTKYLSDNIVFLSIIKNKDLNRYYNEADVLVQPSINEGVSLVMAEALACGCPVIATENTGAEDLFTNNKEGFIIKAQSSSSILQKLELLAENRELRKEMSENAKNIIKKNDGWGEYGNQWNKRLNSLL